MQDAILRIILENGWATVTPAMIRYAMRERGVDVKKDLVVASLERLVARGLLRKVYRGIYVVPQNIREIYENSFVAVKSMYASKLFARGDNGGGSPGEPS